MLSRCISLLSLSKTKAGPTQAIIPSQPFKLFMAEASDAIKRSPYGRSLSDAELTEECQVLWGRLPYPKRNSFITACEEKLEKKKIQRKKKAERKFWNGPGPEPWMLKSRKKLM